MTPAPITQPTQRRVAQPHRPTNPNALTLCDLLYGSGRGFVEICTVEGDPRSGYGGVFKQQGFYAWPSQRVELAQDAIWYTSQGLNVYISSTLYADRTRKHPLPSRVVFLDDAPSDPALPYSATVRTSESSIHAYYITSGNMCNEVRRDLQRRAARATGSDKSGADLQQLVRVPGGVNTKAHGAFPVTLESITSLVYSVNELQAAWPASDVDESIGGSSRATVELDSEAWAKADRWLGNIGALVGANGLPRRMTNPNGESRRVLTDQLKPINKHGIADTSARRAIVAKGLVMHGYPDDEIRALLWHLCDYGAIAQKGCAWLRADIDRLIILYRDELPGVMTSPTKAHQAQPPAQRPQTTYKRKARHDRRGLKGGAMALLAFYKANAINGKHIGRRKTDAVALKVSASTLDRTDDELEAAGLIRVITLKNRSGRVVEVLTPDADSGVVNIESVPVESVGLTPVKGDDCAVEVLSGVNVYGVAMRKTADLVYMEEHTPPVTPVSTPVLAPIITAPSDPGATSASAATDAVTAVYAGGVCPSCSAASGDAEIQQLGSVAPVESAQPSRETTEDWHRRHTRRVKLHGRGECYGETLVKQERSMKADRPADRAGEVTPAQASDTRTADDMELCAVMEGRLAPAPALRLVACERIEYDHAPVAHTVARVGGWKQAGVLVGGIAQETDMKPAVRPGHQLTEPEQLECLPNTQLTKPDSGDDWMGSMQRLKAAERSANQRIKAARTA